MTAAIRNIGRASDELADIHSDVLRLEKRIEGGWHTVREAVTQLSIPDARGTSPMWDPALASRYRRNGHPMKTNPELTANVQAVLNLETKKEAEIVIGAVVDALEHTLLNNLGTDGFSMKLGGFGKFKVRHTRPTRRRIGFSGETVTTKAKRKVRFVPLGMLRSSEDVREESRTERRKSN